MSPASASRLAAVFPCGEVRGPGSDDDLEVESELEPGERPAVGPDEPRLRAAVGLELDGQVLAGLLAGELDCRSPLMIGVEEDHGHGLSRDRAHAARIVRRGRRSTGRPSLRVSILDLEP